MKKGILLSGICSSLLVGCATTASHDTAPFDEATTASSILMDRQALLEFTTDYYGAANHKAFAQSEVGSWAWVTNRLSPDKATSNALNMCRSANQDHEESFPCTLVNVDGEWLQ